MNGNHNDDLNKKSPSAPTFYNIADRTISPASHKSSSFSESATPPNSTKRNNNVSLVLVYNLSVLTVNYSVKHQMLITCIAWSNNDYTSVGCIDGTTIYDVNKLHQTGDFNNLIKKYENSSDMDIHRPLIKTLNPPYLTIDTSNMIDQQAQEIDFHPYTNSTPQIVTCNSRSIHFYEFFNKNHKHNVRKTPILSIDECFDLRTVQYHPSGQYVVAAGDSCYVRLYDIKKEQGYISRVNDNKDYNIVQLRWSTNGNFYAACSNSGDIRLYDGRSMECVNCISKIHYGLKITCIRLSKNDKYLLSTGYDNSTKLTDLRVGRKCQEYNNCNNIKTHNMQCNFTYNDEHIIVYSNQSKKIYIYDTNTGLKIKHFKDDTVHLLYHQQNRRLCMAQNKIIIIKLDFGQLLKLWMIIMITIIMRKKIVPISRLIQDEQEWEINLIYKKLVCLFIYMFYYCSIL